MTKRATIPRQPVLPLAQDWQALRAQGITRLQNLSGKIWTDHNTHDPGITTLELLAYALTDLSYRMDFPTADLLTRPDGTMDDPAISGLQPAQEVLPTAPRTADDYRRLMMRIDGIRNAWAIPLASGTAETAIYADCLADSLSISATNAAAQPNHPVPLSGFWSMRLDLENDDRLGVMNEAALQYRVKAGPLKGVVLRLDCLAPAFLDATLDRNALLQSHTVGAVVQVPLGYTAPLALTFAAGQQNLAPWLVRVIQDKPRLDQPAIAIDVAKITTLLADTAPEAIVPVFWEKQNRQAQILARTASALHSNRGLCEDFLHIDTVDPFRVGICADIEMAADGDLELVQAAVFHAIETYLAPPVQYRSLDELLASGQPVDQIFNGPYLDVTQTFNATPLFTKPGFLTDVDLAATDLRRAVHVSDIINLITEIPGLAAIRNVQLRAYDGNGLAYGTSQSWTLAVPLGHLPVFHIEGSKILFHRDGIPYRAQLTEFEQSLAELRALDRRDVYVPPNQILPQPMGRWRSLDAFQSVQHDFPETYKVGAAGISALESLARIAQARQFKGYLTFFDQVLGDYLGQLTGLRRLYSLDKTLDRSWFSLRLTGIAGSRAEFDDEFLTDKTAYSNDLIRTRLTETEEDFLERRNRVLDHLIARFAERFADYALLQFRLSGDRLGTSADLMADKIDFLTAYPKLSRERGQGANIRPELAETVWDSANISGLERRAGRLMGINDLTRRALACAGHFAALFTTLAEGAAFRVIVKDSANVQLFASDETFPTRALALAAAQKCYTTLRDQGGITIAPRGATQQFEISLAGVGQSLVHRPAFGTQIDATQAARRLIDHYDLLLAADICNAEGMHLIEHILLRPRAPDHALMPVCLPQDCAFCGEQDPYSFRVSVVLPYWPERFRNLDFRALVERTLRTEAPAHVHVRVCWVGQAQMADLDAAHKAWLLALRGGSATELRLPAQRLIGILGTLTTVYPAAALHDCDIGDAMPVVRLGATALGIF